VVLHSEFQLLVPANAVPSSLILSALMMDAIHSSEMSVLTRATWCHTPEDDILHTQTCCCCCCVFLQVWDTVRRVRCLWEGNIKESLSVSLAVGMLNQEIVTFSGDTAVAHLDIQVHDCILYQIHFCAIFVEQEMQL
jgi:hypothetical protein